MQRNKETTAGVNKRKESPVPSEQQKIKFWYRFTDSTKGTTAGLDGRSFDTCSNVPENVRTVAKKPTMGWNSASTENEENSDSHVRADVGALRRVNGRNFVVRPSTEENKRSFSAWSSTSREPENVLDWLSHDLMVEIACYLSDWQKTRAWIDEGEGECKRWCERWRAAIGESVHEVTLDCSAVPDMVFALGVFSSYKRFPHLQRVTIDASHALIKPMLNIPEIVDAGRWVSLNRESVGYLLNGCRNLKSFSILFGNDSLEHGGKKITAGNDSALMQLRRTGTLQVFRSRNAVFADQSLSQLLLSWKDLRVLDLSWARLTDGPHAHGEWQASGADGSKILKAIGILSRLQVLSLKDWLLRDDDLIVFLPFLRDLRSLTLGRTPVPVYFHRTLFLTDVSLDLISKHCDQLQMLNLHLEVGITAEGLKRVLQSCPLRELHIGATNVEPREVVMLSPISGTLLMLCCSFPDAEAMEVMSVSGGRVVVYRVRNEEGQSEVRELFEPSAPLPGSLLETRRLSLAMIEQANKRSADVTVFNKWELSCDLFKAWA